MSELTIGGLSRILRECVGEDGSTRWEDTLDVPFDEMGYDSVALLEVAGRIHAEHGVVLENEQIFAAGTPRQLLDLVNTSVAANH